MALSMCISCFKLHLLYFPLSLNNKPKIPNPFVNEYKMCYLNGNYMIALRRLPELIVILLV